MPSLTTKDGRTLAWHERGSGPPLLCHPGGPGCSSAYFGDLAGLAAERTLLLLDPRGTGASDPPADPAAYDLEDYADDIEAVRRHLGIERLDLLGHSHGGFVAMPWAARHAEHVRKLVLASTAPRFTDAIRQARRDRVASHAGQPYFADSMEALKQREAGQYANDTELTELYRREGVLFAPLGVDPAPVLDALILAGDNSDALRHFNEEIAGTMDQRPLLGARARADARDHRIRGRVRLRGARDRRRAARRHPRHPPGRRPLPVPRARRRGGVVAGRARLPPRLGEPPGPGPGRAWPLGVRG